MCLLVIAWRSHARFPLIAAANRDEFHDRPAAPLEQWSAPPYLLGGRDLRAGGTWLALDRARRFGVVTNYRDLQRPAPDAPSRGELIPQYLAGASGPGEFLTELAPRASQYSGFNLLLADERELWYGSNRAPGFARPLPPGLYGLSNHLLDTPWPKLARARKAFESWLAALPAQGKPARSAVDSLLGILEDRAPAGAGEPLPETGLPSEWERVLSSPFVLHPEYGTRSSTVVLIDRDGALLVRERRFEPSGNQSGETEIDLPPGAWP
ncbi:MAG TPA: NRDE family protein [Steroidobacteraceae bacterium]|nr:NRDE family protein [Steroidobacteraceae bacterium]